MKPAYVDQTVKIEGKSLTLTRLNKILYPEDGFTKAQVLDYYRQISPWMLPHLDNRMLTLKRYPEGTHGLFFYEKRCPAYKPAWMKTKRIKSTHGKEDITYCEVENLPGLLWIANLATLEFHTLLSTAANPKRPSSMVFDLDPGPGFGLHDCCRTALILRNFFKQFKLECFPKTSGGKGLHFYIPLNTPVTFDQTKQFAHDTAQLFAQKYPAEITANMKKSERGNRIFIDWSQNDSHKTTVCVYSLRAKEHPYVSMPLEWKEVEACARAKKDTAYQFTADKAVARVKKRGDLFKPVLTMKQTLLSRSSR